MIIQEKLFHVVMLAFRWRSKKVFGFPFCLMPVYDLKLEILSAWWIYLGTMVLAFADIRHIKCQPFFTAIGGP